MTYCDIYLVRCAVHPVLTEAFLPLLQQTAQTNLYMLDIAFLLGAQDPAPEPSTKSSHDTSLEDCRMLTEAFVAFQVLTKLLQACYAISPTT